MSIMNIEGAKLFPYMMSPRDIILFFQETRCARIEERRVAAAKRLGTSDLTIRPHCSRAQRSNICLFGIA